MSKKKGVSLGGTKPKTEKPGSNGTVVQSRRLNTGTQAIAIIKVRCRAGTFEWRYGRFRNAQYHAGSAFAGRRERAGIASMADEREWLMSADAAAGDTLASDPPAVTSAADLAAALTFIVEDEASVCPSHKRLLERALTFLTPWSAPTLPLQPDAELVRLGSALDAAWAAKDAIEEAGGDGFDEAYAVALAVARRIEALPATTLAGLRVKARVFAWCHGGEPIAADDLVAGHTADMRMVAAIVRDLLAA